LRQARIHKASDPCDRTCGTSFQLDKLKLYRVRSKISKSWDSAIRLKQLFMQDSELSQALLT
jgi:hypothetical protein